MASGPPKVFISYSHRDKQWLDDLETNLKPYLRDGSLTSWSDIRIQPGSEWFAEIKSALTSCNVAVFLVSPDFLNSDFIHEQELGPVLKETTRGGVKVLWVPIRDSAYKKTLLKDCQAVLDPSKPLASMTKAQRDKAWVKICEEIEKAVNRAEESLPEATPNAAGREVPLSNLPDRNPFFTGREGLLVQLQDALAARGRAAVTGLGGVGKTQTALEYAYRHLDEYGYALWATADSHEALVSSYATIASLLKLPEAGAQDQMLAVDAFKRWHTSHEGWLLILDNADDLSMAREFIPPGKKGHVLLTTRARATGVLARLVEIQEMGNDEGALFLLRRAKYITEDASLDVATKDDQTHAKEVAALLDGLPLALDQAGAYIEETGCGLSAYLSLYRHGAPELLRRRGMMASDHPDPVAVTWALSFEKIEKARPAAAELLRFCAFLHPDGIPQEVFSQGAPELGVVLEPAGSDQLALDEAISEILKYSLLRRDPSARILEIHRLVQAVLKQSMDETTQLLWAKRAVRSVNRAFPKVEFSTWAACERLLPQAYACMELINQWSFEFLEVARLLNETGFYLKERGRYSDAKPLYERSLAIREKALGPEHPDVAASLNNLATLYATQGQYGKAEPLYQRALAIREKTVGFEHPDVATTLNSLAVLYHNQGQYGKVEPLHRRSMAIQEKVLGPEHPDVASGFNNLANLYVDQGRYGKAEPLYQRALAIREKALGPEHPDVASSLNNLAGLYVNQGQYGKAEPLHQRALVIWEKALGPEHPDVAFSLHNLAGLYHLQGQYGKAEPLYQRALAIWEKALGLEHPNVALNLNNLAGLYDSQGRYAEAEPLCQRALAIREKTLGPEHRDVALSFHCLAVVYHRLRQYGKAESLYRHSLAIREKAPGPEEIDVALCLENYALLLRKMDRPEEAEPLQARARAIRAKSA